jgi:hypothetical protein
MTDKSGDFLQVLATHYEINGEPDDIYETFESGFEKQRFRANDKRYNLVYCKKNFAGNKELISEMTNSELITVKSYYFVEQSRSIEDYYLYELIPYTVQGVAEW